MFNIFLPAEDFKE